MKVKVRTMDRCMGEFFGLGEDLKHARYNVPSPFGFSSRAFSFIPSLPPGIQPSPLLMNPSSCRYNLSPASRKTCNGKPKIHIDQDTDAWLRRLVVLSFKTPTHEQHFGKMVELILKNESCGILNWLLEGRAKLSKEKLQLTQTPEQKTRAATLLLASDSPSAFVRSCLVKKKDGGIGHPGSLCALSGMVPG
jgi:hypothetical protein